MDAQVDDGTYDSGRLIAFSDGIVAIGATLLILPLASIELPHTPDAENNPLGYIWSNYYPLIVSFLISWFVIIIFWLVHHRIFEKLDRVNTPILWFNIIWLFAVVVLPFPTSLIGQTGDDPKGGLVAFYIANMFVISLMLTLISWSAARNPRLLAEGVTPFAMNGSVRGQVIAGYLAICMIAGYFIPEYATWALLGIVLLGPLSTAIDAKLAARRAQQRQSTSSSR